jgi:magnesium transporter
MIETIQYKTLNWHHISKPSDKDFQYLQNNYDFHPLDIEDCRSKVQRPKIDVYDDYYFIILHFPYFDKSNKFLITKEVKIFWGKNYIITIGKSHLVVKELFNKAKKTKKFSGELELNTSDALLYIILEQLLKETLIIIRNIGDIVNIISNDLFAKHPKKIIELISVTRKNIILLNTIIKPQLRLFTKFESGEIKGFAEDMEEYWGNILDYYQKSWDLTEDYQELIEGLSKTFDSLQTNKINEIMKVLTFFSTTLLPLTFITGLYGMNIGLPLQNRPESFWVIIGSMLVIVILLVFYFKKKKWI